jgi:hypothetical protein
MIGKIRDTITGLWPILKGNMPKPRQVIIIVVAFLIGLIWSYVLDPTTFYNADPNTLSQGWQDEFVRLAAERYALKTANAAPTDELNQNIITLLKSVDEPLEVVNRLQLGQPMVDLATQAEAAAAKAPQPNFIGSIRPFILGSIVVVIVTLVGSLLYNFYIGPMVVEPIRKRLRGSQGKDQAGTDKIHSIQAARKMADELAKQDAAAPTNNLGPPVTRHVSIYAPGRSFDDSFGIEDAKKDDEFLGECGAVISETIGAEDKVTAIEVWLFDKEDFVRTLTGVFVSEYAYNDPAIRSKLEPKGELVLAKPGAVLVLETNALKMQARIVDMAYGTGPLPPNSYFEKMTIELQSWRNTGGGTAVAAPATAVAMPPAPLPVSKPFAQPSAPLASPSFAPPPMPASPSQPAPSFSGSPITPLPPSPPPRRQLDDDPFGGTGDFTPVS